MASHPSGLTALAASLLLITNAFVGSLCGQDPRVDYDLAMWSRPEIPQPEFIRQFPTGLQQLWVKALERPDVELQRFIIDTLSIAHQRGLDGLAELQPRLIELLKQPDQSLHVTRAVVATLIAMEARGHAASIAGAARTYGLPVAQLAEPALAKWKSAALKEDWMQRVSEGTSSDTMLVMAIDGLGSLETTAATESLTKFIRDVNRSVQVRIASARALGNTHASGLNELARKIIPSASKWPGLNAIIAIELLAKHDDEATINLLEQLVDHDSSAVQSRALARLFELDFQFVHRHAADLIASSDANVRRHCARAMLANGELTDIRPLSILLDDVNPGLRREVANGLLRLASAEQLREEIVASTTEVLQQDSWRGCEQAAVVLAKLDHEAAGPRLVELLGHPRGEVKVASAWALTQLRVESLLPDMLDHASSIFDGFKSGQINDGMRGMSLHVAHLFVAFGDQRYKAADPLLRKYLPKNFDIGDHARGAAVWSLGLIHESEGPNARLIDIMVERLSDTQSMEPELEVVRRMCAISLARLKASSALPAIRSYAVGRDPVSRACYWAIEQLTGETPPPMQPIIQSIDDWILAPIKS